jgi:tetratricopeptide (TPR) repeat protein
MAKSSFKLFNTYISLIVFIFISIHLYGQYNNEKALDLFNSKNYKEALPFFKESYDKFHDNKNVSYFFGVCLVETENYGIETTKLLMNATKGDVPFNVNFYIAKNYHALNKFELASAYYQMFLNNGRSKEIKETNVKDLIKMASKRINPFEKRNIKENNGLNSNELNQDTIIHDAKINTKDESNTVSFSDSNSSSIINTEKELINYTDSISDTDTSTILIYGFNNDSIINFNISSEITYMKVNQFKTKSGKIHFIEGWKYSSDLSEKIKMTDELRKKYETVDSYEEKNKISDKVLELEKTIYDLKKFSDFEYSKSREAENLYWINKEFHEKEKIKKENDSIIYTEKDRLKKLILSNKEEFETTESVSVDSSISNDNDLTINNSLKEAMVPSNGIIYKIQIGAFKTELPPASKALFKKLSVLRKIDNYIDDKGVTYYTIGEVSNFKDAVKLQDQIRKESVKDAFIIIFKDGKKLSYSETKHYLK